MKSIKNKIRGKVEWKWRHFNMNGSCDHLLYQYDGLVEVNEKFHVNAIDFLFHKTVRDYDWSGRNRYKLMEWIVRQYPRRSAIFEHVDFDIKDFEWI